MKKEENDVEGASEEATDDWALLKMGQKFGRNKWNRS